MVLQERHLRRQNLRHRQTGVLFKTTVQEDDAYVYVVIEHQSTPDPLMAFRMLQYQVRIQDRHVKQHTIRPGQRPLPQCPVVRLPERRSQTAPTDIADLLDINDSLGAATRRSDTPRELHRLTTSPPSAPFLP